MVLYLYEFMNLLSHYLHEHGKKKKTLQVKK